jgi:hypothetical protein
MPGWFGIVITVTARVLAALVPHALLAVTLIVPPVPPIVTVMLFVVELPLQVPGSVQL